MSFLKAIKKKDDTAQAMNFQKEICKRYGAEANLFTLPSNHIMKPKIDQKMKSVMEITSQYSFLDDMLTAFTVIEKKLKNEVDELSAENRILEEKLLRSNYDHKNKEQLLDNLKEANQCLMNENGSFFNDSLRHRFLKLQTNELNATKAHMMGILERKRNQSLAIRSELDKLTQEQQNLNKEREKAGLNVAHTYTRLKDLYTTSKEMDILREEQLRKRLLISRMRRRDGPVRVYLVTRPTSSQSCVSFMSLQRIVVQGNTSSKPRSKLGTVFQFHRVFKPNDDMNDLFDDINLHALAVVDGFNTAFVAYGQTGTGKTQTMLGTGNKPCLLQYVLTSVSTEIQTRKTWSFTISCSVLEVNDVGVYDMLSKDPKPVNILDDGFKLCMSREIAELAICDDGITQVVDQVKELRITGRSSSLQEGSTRRHLVVIIRVRGFDKGSLEDTIDGTTLIADLAGFEDVNHLVNMPEDVIQQAFTNNRSLNTFSEVLTALRKGKSLVPFHKSPLTVLLKPCLIGDAHLCLLLHSHTQFEEHSSIMKTMCFGANAIRKRKKFKGRRITWKV